MSGISAVETRQHPRLTGAGTSGLLTSGHTPWPARILVCADDGAPTGDALAAARALAQRSGADVDVLAVFAPRIPVPDVPDRRGLARCEERDRGAAAELIRAVRSEAQRRQGGHSTWPVHLEVGNPVLAIIENARRSRADLVITGLGNRDSLVHRSGLARLVCLARYTEVPMLAAAPIQTALPREAVLFIDREPPDMALIRTALRCIEDAAVVWVLIYSGTTERSGDGVRHDKNTLARVLGAIRREAAAVSKDIVVRGVYRAGDPLDAMLSLAREVDADLIAAPLHGAAGTIRSLVPNVADRLLATAPCSVLVVPEST